MNSKVLGISHSKGSRLLKNFTFHLARNCENVISCDNSIRIQKF